MTDNPQARHRARTRAAVPRLVAVTAALVLALAVSALGLAGAAPAGAREYPASHAHVGGSSHGFVTFETKGDKLSLCDLRPDGYSVGVQWWLSVHGNWIRQTNHYNYWGLDTCRTFSESDLPEGAFIRYRACLYDHAKPGGSPPVQVGGTCGPTIEANTR
ncbi:MAG TPA: hypothetical protein VIL36_01460 [Acidimicrobiales bacterium]